MTREEILGMEAGFALDTLVELHVFNHTKSMYLQAGPYSTDIKAAWEVVEKLVTSNKRVMIYNLIQGFKVKIFLSTGEVIVNINAKTVPEAICKAALLAMLAEKAEV